jgi:mannitol-specific phosphotransferase system IIBC component
MPTLNATDIHKIVVACDAGMGSSVMLASQLRKQLSKHNVVVEHTPVNAIPGDADLIVTHAGLAERARQGAGGIPIVPFTVFLGDPQIARLVDAIKRGGPVDV